MDMKLRRTSLRVLAFAVVTLLGLGTTRAQEPVQVVQPVTHTFETLALTFPEGKTITVKIKGTERLSEANGQAKVERKQGSTEIEIELDEMKPAGSFGGDFNGYVLWGVSPEGFATNLGEFVLNGNRGKLNVSTRLQVFGLLITAEPHYLVRRPSRFVVLQIDRPADSLKIPVQTAKVEYRAQEGVYRADHESLAGVPEAKIEVRSELAQARTAVRLAADAKAEQLDSQRFGEVQSALQKAEEASRSKVDPKRVLELSHATVRLAYESQLSSQTRAVELALEAERKAKADEAARLESERQKAELAKAEEARRRAEAEAASARAQADAEASRRQTEEAQRQQEASRLAAARAEAEKAELRARLLAQFNAILPTTDSERGLVVNIGDVLFDTGKFNLRQEALLKLARFAGIILNYPALSIQSEGHTDTTGSEAFNQNLSEQRAGTVRDFLISQGIAAEKVTAVGRGFAAPVADNQTAEGRRMNRRVELIISGEVIGTKVGS